MNTKIDQKRIGQLGQAVVLYIIAILVVIVVMGLVLWLFINTIQRVVPPAPGHALLPVGSQYGGGTIVGYTNSYGKTASVQAVTNTTFTLLMYADFDAANVITNWQNCRFVKSQTYVGWTLGQAYADFCPSNQPQETWPLDLAPSQQFYNILISQ